MHLKTLLTTERIQTDILTRFVKVLVQAQALTEGHYDTLKARAMSVETAMGQINPAKDQDLFIDHNIRAYTPPRDWEFEPCSSHYDTVSCPYLCIYLFLDD